MFNVMSMLKRTMFVLSYYVHGKQVHIEYLRLFWSTGRTQVRNFLSFIKIAFRSVTVFSEIFLIASHASEQTGSPFLFIILPISSAIHRRQYLKITFVILVIYLRSKLNKKYAITQNTESCICFRFIIFFHVNIYTLKLHNILHTLVIHQIHKLVIFFRWPY